MNESVLTLTRSSCSDLFDESLLFLASTHSLNHLCLHPSLSEAPADEEPTQKEEPEDEGEEDEEEYHYVYEDEEVDKEDEYEKKERSKTSENQDEDKTLQEVKGL